MLRRAAGLVLALGACTTGDAAHDAVLDAATRDVAASDTSDASADSDLGGGGLGRVALDGGPPGPPLAPSGSVDPDVAATPPAREAVGAPTARVVDVLAFDAFEMPERRNDSIGNGWGLGLVDGDGDGDLDVFLSGSIDGPPACLFDNISTPGVVAFDLRPVFCVRDRDVISASAVDVDDDGRQELVLGTADGPLLWRLHPEVAVTELPDDDPPCVASNVLAIDLDSDGDRDLLAGCQTVRGFGRPAQRVRDRAWLQTADGWEPLDEPWLREGNTLALGLVDRDDDGLLDVAVIVDTLSGREARNTGEEPGGWLTRCGPTEDCRFTLTPFRDDATAWGSFMGFGVTLLPDAGPHVVLTDWGENRLLPLDGVGADVASARGVSLRRRGEEDRFHWGVAVEDWNGDGTDDLYIAQGTVPFESEALAVEHFDVLLLQSSRGRFTPVEAPSLADEGGTRRHRAAVRADLDSDGAPEVLLAPLAGRYRVVTVTPPSPTGGCTLRPRPRYALADRGGWALGPTEDGPWHRRDTAGQHQAGTSPYALSSLPSGWLRFASGARVPFDCATDAGALIEEPDWLTVERRGEQLRVVIDEAVRGRVEDVDAAVRTPSGVQRRPARRDADAWVLDLDAADEALMVRVDGRWVDRWIPVPP